MKTKVSQKEWNDKRDMFLCSLITALAAQEGGLNITWAIMEAESYTSELYEVEEVKQARPMTEEEKKAQEHLQSVKDRHDQGVFTLDVLNASISTTKLERELLAELKKEVNDPLNKSNEESLKDAADALSYALVKGVEEKTGEEVVAIHGHTEKSFVIPANSIKEGDTLSFRAKMTSKPTDDSKTTVKIVSDVRNEVEDTRPFNPKVVEIFNEFLPKEIAPLAIEAHKETITDMPSWIDVQCDNLFRAFVWGILLKANPSFESLFMHTDGNTITATPEQLREWFPLAYKNEGGTNENP